MQENVATLFPEGHNVSDSGHQAPQQQLCGAWLVLQSREGSSVGPQQHLQVHGRQQWWPKQAEHTHLAVSLGCRCLCSSRGWL